MSSAPVSLNGRRVLLTRSAEDCAEWAARIARHGAVPVVLPCIRCEPIDKPELRGALAAAIGAADWLALTSARGADACARLCAPPLPPRVRVAVVGAATAEAARRALGRVDLVGRGGTAAGLAETLAADGELAAHANVVVAVAENARAALERVLTARGARCTRFDVYRTLPAPARHPKHALSALRADDIVLASPSAVTGLVHQVDLDTSAAIYTIGPSTTAAARAHGLAVAAEAAEPSLEGLLEVMRCGS